MIVTFGVVNLAVFGSVVLIYFSKFLYCITHAIESNRHEIEFDELRMLISHVIDSDTGNSIILMIDVLIVKIKELVDKGIRLSDLLEYHIDKLLVFGDFEKECHPD